MLLGCPWDLTAHGRTKLSKALITDAKKLEWRSLTDLQTKFGVDYNEGVVRLAIRFTLG